MEAGGLGLVLMDVLLKKGGVKLEKTASKSNFPLLNTLRFVLALLPASLHSTPFILALSQPNRNSLPVS